MLVTQTGAAGWKAQTNPLRYGGIPSKSISSSTFLFNGKTKNVKKMFFKVDFSNFFTRV